MNRPIAYDVVRDLDFLRRPIRDIVATDDVIYVLTASGLIGGYREGAPVPATPTPTP